jgi:hypothetical protein
MDLNMVAYFAGAWLLVSVATSVALARFIRRGNAPRDEWDATKIPSSPKVVSYLDRPRRKAASRAEVHTVAPQSATAARRRAV